MLLFVRRCPVLLLGVGCASASVVLLLCVWFVVWSGYCGRRCSWWRVAPPLFRLCLYLPQRGGVVGCQVAADVCRTVGILVFFVGPPGFGPLSFRSDLVWWGTSSWTLGQILGDLGRSVLVGSPVSRGWRAVDWVLRGGCVGREAVCICV